jgi:hypothetical protein
LSARRLMLFPGTEKECWWWNSCNKGSQ